MWSVCKTVSIQVIKPSMRDDVKNDRVKNRIRAYLLQPVGEDIVKSLARTLCQQQPGQCSEQPRENSQSRN